MEECDRQIDDFTNRIKAEENLLAKYVHDAKTHTSSLNNLSEKFDLLDKNSKKKMLDFVFKEFKLKDGRLVPTFRFPISFFIKNDAA